MSLAFGFALPRVWESSGGTPAPPAAGTQVQIPNGAYLDQTSTDQVQIPGGAYVDGA